MTQAEKYAQIMREHFPYVPYEPEKQEQFQKIVEEALEESKIDMTLEVSKDLINDENSPRKKDFKKLKELITSKLSKIEETESNMYNSSYGEGEEEDYSDDEYDRHGYKRRGRRNQRGSNRRSAKNSRSGSPKKRRGGVPSKFSRERARKSRSASRTNSPLKPARASRGSKRPRQRVDKYGRKIASRNSSLEKNSRKSSAKKMGRKNITGGYEKGGVTRGGKRVKSGSRSPNKYLKETESFNRDKFSVGKRRKRKTGNYNTSSILDRSRNRKDPLDRLNR